jgi:5,10-methylenetetrahydrofolate reductase
MPPPPPEMRREVTTMSLRDHIQAGDFLITGEVAPPKGADFHEMLEEAEHLRGRVHGINVTDLQSAVMRASSLAGCIKLAQAGHDPVLQVVCRDRNRISLQSELLSAAAFGITDFLALTGDYITLGDDQAAKPVFDLDSVNLITAARLLEGGHDLGGNELQGPPPSFCIGCVVNPGLDPLELQIMKLRKKIAAGAEFVQTQAIYEPERLIRFHEMAGDLGVPVMAGLVVLKSAGMARFMNANVAGVLVPDELIERIKGSADRQQEAVAITVELIQALRPHCDGVHLMPLGWTHIVPAILDGAGL